MCVTHYPEQICSSRALQSQFSDHEDKEINGLIDAHPSVLTVRLISLLACLPACLRASVSTLLSFCLPADMPRCLFVCMPVYSINSWILYQIRGIFCFRYIFLRFFPFSPLHVKGHTIFLWHFTIFLLVQLANDDIAFKCVYLIIHFQSFEQKNFLS